MVDTAYSQLRGSKRKVLAHTGANSIHIEGMRKKKLAEYLLLKIHSFILNTQRRGYFDRPRESKQNSNIIVHTCRVIWE